MPADLQPLVGVQQHNIALLFANYLQTQDITAKVVEEDGQYVIYCQLDKYADARAIFEEFIEHPYDAKYQSAAWQSAQVTKVVSDSPSLLAAFKTQFLAHAGVVTLIVFAICWGVYLVSVFGAQRLLFSQLHFYTALTTEQFFDNPLRLIGPAFFHFSILHIAFNTMWWWQLGGAIERQMGKFALIQLFLVSAIASNLGQFLVTGPNFGGLSGVVYGVVGYVWWAGWLAPEKGLTLSRPIIGFLLFWILLGFADLLPVNMANTAHLVGLMVGCLLAWLTFANKSKQANA